MIPIYTLNSKLSYQKNNSISTSTFPKIALDAIIDVKCLPTGFNTTHPPLPNNCDLCNKPLIENNHMKY
ncbi:17312_t:CDS:2 [Funneliformis caledonium]|uniref:17312_t:CDS:1 n=1 Tax=Funneliformis caledonium TaxID=1117310 RepID=A0A9N9G188_9GLOM|nr:17312_t:CDS:2 [Funneliformis caledonium]